MSDEINPHEKKIPAEVIERNFLAIQDHMKLMQKQYDDLHAEFVTFRAVVAQVQQETALLRQQMTTALVAHIGNGPTG